MWIDSILSRSPAQPVFRWRASRQLTILAYHGVDVPERFAEQLDYLASTMHPVSLGVVLDAIAARRPLPKRAVLVTFDDGQRSLVEIAMPMLRDRGIPAVAFVVAGLLDTSTPFWWDEVKELVEKGGTTGGFSGLAPDDMVRRLKSVPDAQRHAAIEELRRTASAVTTPVPQLKREELVALEASGITIGNHSTTHPSLPRCDDEKIAAEISGAHEILTAALGRPPKAFAYPYGHADERAAQVLADLGYEAAFLFDHRLSVFPPPDPLRISRLRANSMSRLPRFRIIVSGLHSTLHHARARMGTGLATVENL